MDIGEISRKWELEAFRKLTSKYRLWPGNGGCTGLGFRIRERK